MSLSITPGPPALLICGVPAVFGLFALVLLGVALFHQRALVVTLAGLAAIVVFRSLADGLGFAAVFKQLGHDWVTLSNLLLLLLGFEILSNHFEKSHLPDRIPGLLPEGW